jgi:hypothetical protein
MNRLRRWLFNVFSGLSLLLFIGVASFWVRSFWVERLWGDIFHLDYSGNSYHSYQLQIYLSFSDGCASLDFKRYTDGLNFISLFPPGIHPKFSHEYNFTGGFGQNWHGFFWQYDDSHGYYMTYRTIDGNLTCPQWLMLVVFGFLPVVAVTRKVIDRKMLTPLTCRQCGYDLRATPDRCPECGTVAEKKEIIST